MEFIVGIDLGTTNSEIAVIQNGKPHVIPIEGETIMPSCVGITPEGELITGRTAKNQMAAAPDKTILSVKRKMGTSESLLLGGRDYSPEEISALILRKLKKEAEDYCGSSISKAVVTVPAYFDDFQRKATRNAGTLAGLEVVRVINEPTAAALAYDTQLEKDEAILVYDLGGGTFDVSLVVVEKGVVEVKASHGDTHLGGDDFDQLLIDHVFEKFREAHEIDLSGNLGAKYRIWAAAEKAKKELSMAPYARIREEFIHGDLHLDMEIARDDYEEMIRPLLRKTINSVHHCINDAGYLPKDIDKRGAIRRICLCRLSSATRRCR